MQNKRGVEVVNSRSSDHKTSSDKLLYYWYIPWPSLMCNIKRFSSYSKNYVNLCKPVHDIINSFAFICPFESEKCGKEGKITKIWIY